MKSKWKKTVQSSLKNTQKARKQVEKKVQRWMKEHPEATREAKKFAGEVAKRSRNAYNIMKGEVGEAWDKVSERVHFVHYDDYVALEKRVQALEAIIVLGAKPARKAPAKKKRVPVTKATKPKKKTVSRKK